VSHSLIHFGFVALGDILDILFVLLELILRDDLVLFELFQLVDGIAADIPEGNFVILGLFLEILDNFLAALAGQRRQVQPDNLAVIGRGQADVSVLSLSRSDRSSWLPRGNSDCAGLEWPCGNLADGGRVAVIINLD
jgi:hypothetical protein